MAIGERKKIKGVSAIKVVESVIITPNERKIRLDIWKTEEPVGPAPLYIFTANDFIQCYNQDKTSVIVEMASYIADNL